MSTAKHYMPLYVGDYLADTAHLTVTEHGAYLLLIMHYWRAGALPDDDAQLARIARCTAREWAKIRDVIAAFFDDGWVHRRIEAEATKAREAYDRRSRAGRSGGKAKAASKQSSSIARAMTKQPEPEPELEDKEERERVRATRLPPDWTPTENDREFALTEGLNSDEINREAEKFRDYWTGKAGQNGRKTDWSATWRNWIRRACEGGQQRGPAKPNVLRNRLEIIAASAGIGGNG